MLQGNQISVVNSRQKSFLDSLILVYGIINEDGSGYNSMV